MKRIALLLLVCTLALASIFAQPSQAKMNKKHVATVTTGLQDRAYWSALLYKMAIPVVKNLANSTLKKNMPLELAPKYALNPEVTYLEAVGRTMAGIAPWLALPDDDTAEGKMRLELRTLLLQGLKNAFDPQNPDCINFKKGQQPIVDAAYMSHAFLRAPKALWQPLDHETKENIISAFKSLRNRTGAYNNWLLFAGMNEAFLLSIGQEPDNARIEIARHKIKEWYVGDGWYSDGPSFSLDYYNSYVIHPMMVDFLGTLLNYKRASKEEYDLAVKRLTRNAEFSERFISPEGTYPAFGRSITYRTAAFQSLAQAVLMEKLPTGISNAQIRCALTTVFHRMYHQNSNFDQNGWLVLGFCGHQPEIADYYTSTGSLYMATLGFLDLGLPANHPFWTDAAEDWTSKKAWSGKSFKKDYHVEY